MLRALLGLALVCPLLLIAEEENRIPNFSLKDIYREEVTLDSILSENKVVMISFWDINCKACIKELTIMDPIYEEYHEMGFEVLAINEDSPRLQSQVKPFVEARKWKYRVLLDEDASVRNLLKVFALPTTILVNKEGILLFHRIGYREGAEDDIEEIVHNIIAE